MPKGERAPAAFLGAVPRLVPRKGAKARAPQRVPFQTVRPHASNAGRGTRERSDLHLPGSPHKNCRGERAQWSMLRAQISGRTTPACRSQSTGRQTLTGLSTKSGGDGDNEKGKQPGTTATLAGREGPWAGEKKDDRGTRHGRRTARRGVEEGVSGSRRTEPQRCIGPAVLGLVAR